MVHLLPHERMDLYRKSVGKLEGMRMTLLQEKCVCKKDGSTKVDGDCEEDNDCEYKCEEEKSNKEEKEKCMWPVAIKSWRQNNFKGKRRNKKASNS